MFLLVLVFLRASGKKGVRQLSLFEVAIIISLGSAAGDPMFTKDVPIIPALIVFVTIIAVYRLITWLTAKSEKIETILEGNPEYIIEDGMFALNKSNENTFAKDEFLAEMRQQSIEHVGQVKIAILETSGTVSFFYYSDDEVKLGLPVLPKAYSKITDKITALDDYACSYCGQVERLSQPAHCSRCNKKTWVKAIGTCRVV